MKKFLTAGLLALLTLTSAAQSTKGFETVHIHGGYAAGAGTTLSEDDVSANGIISANEALKVEDKINLRLVNPYIDVTNDTNEVAITSFDIQNGETFLNLGAALTPTNAAISSAGITIFPSGDQPESVLGNAWEISFNSSHSNYLEAESCEVEFTPVAGSGLSNNATVIFNEFSYVNSTDETVNTANVTYDIGDFPNVDEPKFGLLADLAYTTDHCEFEITGTLSGTPYTGDVVLDYDSGAGPNVFTIDHNYPTLANIQSVSIIKVSDSSVLYTNNTSGTVQQDPIVIAPSDGAWATVIPLLLDEGALRVRITTTVGNIQGFNNCNQVPRATLISKDLADGETTVPLGILEILTNLPETATIPAGMEIADPPNMSFYITSSAHPYGGVYYEYVADEGCFAKKTSNPPDMAVLVGGPVIPQSLWVGESNLSYNGKFELIGDDSELDADAANITSIQSATAVIDDIETENIEAEQLRLPNTVLDGSSIKTYFDSEQTITLASGFEPAASYTYPCIEILDNGDFASGVTDWSVSTTLSGSQYTFTNVSSKGRVQLSNTAATPLTIIGSVDGDYVANSYVKFEYQVITPKEGTWELKARAYYGADDDDAPFIDIETINITEQYSNSTPTFDLKTVELLVDQDATTDDDLIYFELRFEQTDELYAPLNADKLVIDIDNICLATKFENQEVRFSVPVVNGTFDTDTTGWSETSGPSLGTVASGKLEIDLTAGGTLSYVLDQTIDVDFEGNETFLAFDLSINGSESYWETFLSTNFDGDNKDNQAFKLTVDYENSALDILDFEVYDLIKYAGGTPRRIIVPFVGGGGGVADRLRFVFSTTSDMPASSLLFKLDNVSVTYSDEMREDLNNNNVANSTVTVDGNIEIKNGNLVVKPQVNESIVAVKRETDLGNGPRLTFKALEEDGTLADDDLRVKILGDLELTDLTATTTDVGASTNDSLTATTSLHINSAELLITPVSSVVATGAITYSSYRVLVDTEASAATDDLQTITTSASSGAWVLISSVNSARDTTIKDTIGNIELIGNTDFTLMTVNDYIVLEFDGADWQERARSNSEAFGTYTPTITAVSNFANIVVGKFFYTRHGNVVEVSGTFGADASTNHSNECDITLPIPSNFDGVLAANNQCVGSGFNVGTGTFQGPVFSTSVGSADTATFRMYGSSVASGGTYTVKFSYLVD
jgi:hypothetical protein